MNLKSETALARAVALTLIEHFGPVRFRALVDAFGDMDGIFNAGPEALQSVKNISGPMAEALNDSRLLDHAKREIEKAHKAGVRMISFFDEGYPEVLRQIYDPPVVLYIKGELPAGICVAVVGCRKASAYGLATAADIAKGLAAAGVTVVSGMAKGIDSAAHRAALKAGGMTVAVLGGGLSKIYPAENLALSREIAQKGALVSEYPMDWPPKSEYFPVRNRIISGLSRAVLVVEADEKSGSLITADAALEQGRDVFAVPGNVGAAGSRGTNRLLKQGAKCVTSAEDILQEWSLKPAAVAEPSIPLADDERQMLSFVNGEPAAIDDLIERSRMAAGPAAATLSLLEIKGLIYQLPGKRFVLRRA